MENRTVQNATFEPLVYVVRVDLRDPDATDNLTVYAPAPVGVISDHHYVVLDILGVTYVYPPHRLAGMVWMPTRWRLREATGVPEFSSPVPACLIGGHDAPVQVAVLKDDVWTCPVCTAAARGIEVVS